MSNRVITLYPGESITIGDMTIVVKPKPGLPDQPFTVGDKTTTLPPDMYPSMPATPSPWPLTPGYRPGNIICQGGK